MNIFKIHRDIRRVGFGYGLPLWFIDCGLGVNYKPEDVIRKLATMGMQKGDWVAVRGGLSEKGIGTLIDVLKYVGCRVEVEAFGKHETPAWFTRADRWTVYWTCNGRFNYNGLRRGQDMLICKKEELDAFLTEIGHNDLIDKGLILDGEVDFDTIWKHKMRVYEHG